MSNFGDKEKDEGSSNNNNNNNNNTNNKDKDLEMLPWEFLAPRCVCLSVCLFGVRA
jgi:hypothetical protein